MLAFIIRRVLAMIPTLFLVSILTFIIIQLPPGDFMSSLAALVGSSGSSMDQATVDNMRHQYGLDRPLHIQYLSWIAGFARGDFGYSLDWKSPVADLIGGRLALTVLLSLLSLTIMWAIAIPIGIYSATHQYSLGDNFLSFFSFLGLSVPEFLLALIYMAVGIFAFGVSVTGLFSSEMENAPWSPAKALDLARHLLIPALILGTAGIAQLMRIMRGSMLEVLGQQFITTARAKGLSERTVTNKYAARVLDQPADQRHGHAVAGAHLRRNGLGHRAVDADHRPALLPGADEPGHVPGGHDSAFPRPALDGRQFAGGYRAGSG